MESYQIPEVFNIGHACTSMASQLRNGSETAVIVENEVSGTASISFRQLNLDSNRFAHGLTVLWKNRSDQCSAVASPECEPEAKLGNESTGPRVLLWLPNCLEFPIAFLGTLKQGAVAVPVSTLLASDELIYMLADSGAFLLVTTPVLLQRLELRKVPVGTTILLVGGGERSGQPHSINTSEGIETQSFDDFLESGDEQELPVTTRANDPAYLVYTSGTTGYPKGVLHAHRALLGRLPASQYWFNYQAGSDRILHSGKFNWTYVLGTALMDPLYLGKSVVVYEGAANAKTWPTLIAKHECTIFIGVPTLYRQILQKTQTIGEQVPSLRHCMCAGEHLSDEVLDGWEKRFQLKIYEAIGMSECSYYLSQHVAKPVRPGSAGFPQPGHHVALLDEKFCPVADEEEGMLCIGLNDPGLFLRYWGQPEETSKSKRGDYFLTGDYARRDADGYYWFLGRKDDIINSFGYRVSPMEIERVMKTHPLVLDCVALEESVGPDKNIVGVCIILVDSAQDERSENMKTQLLDFAKSHLAAYKVPKSVHFMTDFPRTANGKVIRSRLKKSIST